MLIFTFTSFLFLLHLSAVFLQLLVSEFGEGVGTLLTDDDLGLVLLFYDGLGSSHQLTLKDTDGKRTRHQEDTFNLGDTLCTLNYGENWMQCQKFGNSQLFEK